MKLKSVSLIRTSLLDGILSKFIFDMSIMWTTLKWPVEDATHLRAVKNEILREEDKR